MADRTSALGIQQLRNTYLKLNPRQRRKIAADKLARPEAIPNQLITVVSATEGLARALALQIEMGRGAALKPAYRKLKDLNAPSLVQCVLKAHGMTPDNTIGESNWQHFKTAVKARNFLIHEAAFINSRDGRTLTRAAGRVFEILETLA